MIRKIQRFCIGLSLMGFLAPILPTPDHCKPPEPVQPIGGKNPIDEEPPPGWEFNDSEVA